MTIRVGSQEGKGRGRAGRRGAGLVADGNGRDRAALCSQPPARARIFHRQPVLSTTRWTDQRSAGKGRGPLASRQAHALIDRHD